MRVSRQKIESANGFIGKVKFQFFGSVRAAAGTDGDEIAVPPDFFVYGALESLSNEYRSAFKGEIFWQADGSLRDDLTVLINGAIIGREKLKDTPIKDGDVIALLPSFPGGG